MIPSLWLGVASFLTDLLSHASKLVITKAGGRLLILGYCRQNRS